MKALISVSNKDNIVAFAKTLVEKGFEIVSTGGTLKVLLENGITAQAISEYTGFPEILDGRVKTLHPKVHGAILADRSNKNHIKTCKDHDIECFNLVVVNLYPFEQTIADPSKKVSDAIENIDIGGPTLLRAAAKNFNSTCVVVNPDDYDDVLENISDKNGDVNIQLRKTLATKAFLHVAQYDIAIANYYTNQFLEGESGMPDIINPVLEKVADLRYGENPHQNAAFYSVSSRLKNKPFQQLHGKELSYNNIIDIASAIDIVKSFTIPAAAVIKHTNPCGAATGDSLKEAYQKAYDADPLSAYGSIVGLNRIVDIKTAELMSKNFIEVIIAPDFEKEAFELLSKKTSLRLIKSSNDDNSKENFFYRYVDNSFLVQSKNELLVEDKDLEIVTSTKPSKSDINDLMFAFNLVKFVKSNAILIANNGQSLGVGAGQMSRVDAVEIALKKAGEKAKGAVLASDAFFPFKDSIELAAKYGIRAIIQPGGSKRDQESIDACDENKIIMAFSGSRHFLH